MTRTRRAARHAGPAHRPVRPDQELLAALGIGVISLPGYEADDLLGTIARQAAARDIRAMLVTGDRDALQLVDDNTSLLFTRKGISESVLFTPGNVKEYFGFTPEQVTDWKGLMGDSSDNIPGIPGVGEKTSVRLLEEYGSLEGVLSHAAEIKGKLGERIRANMDLARLSKQLATINTQAPIRADFRAWMTNRLAEGLPALRKYQLNTMAAELSRMTAVAAKAQEAPEAPAPVLAAKTAEELAAFAGGAGPQPLVLCLAEDALSLGSLSGKAIRLPLQAGQQDLLSPPGSPKRRRSGRSPRPDGEGPITHDASAFSTGCGLRPARPRLHHDTDRLLPA